MNFHGNPCWYELGTSDLDNARAFYAAVLDWDVQDSDMPGSRYLLASAGGEVVAGMMPSTAQEGNPPPNWLTYFAVDDCDKAATDIRVAGGKIFKQPTNIPGTGHFAVTQDPQGAVFGILQLDMSQMGAADRTKAEAGQGAFDQSKAGHGNWHELMTPDPEGGFAFYSGLFGWTKGEAMDMGGSGIYQLIRRNGVDIGAIQPQENSPTPAWLPYFGVKGSVAARVDAIKTAGGQVHMGPIEVPGPAYIAVAADPQGAAFSIAGPQK
ncbi:MAG: VOC family protein [Pseudorhodobacter sp.]